MPSIYMRKCPSASMHASSTVRKEIVYHPTRFIHAREGINTCNFERKFCQCKLYAHRAPNSYEELEHYAARRSSLQSQAPKPRTCCLNKDNMFRSSNARLNHTPYPQPPIRIDTTPSRGVALRPLLTPVS